MAKQKLNDDIQGRFFIVGCARSGSTLLQNLLDSHPDIQSFPESHLFSRIQSNGWKKILKLANKAGVKRFFEFLDEIKKPEFKELLPFCSFFEGQYTSTFIKILDLVAIKNGKAFWVEKTPLNLHYIDLIEKHIQNAKFIHIIRNGEDVVASMYEVTHKYPERWGGLRSIDMCIERWKKDIATTEKHMSQCNHFVIKYEDLTDDTELVLGAVCKFIGVTYYETMIANGNPEADKIILPHEKWKQSAKDGIFRNKERKFENIFSDKEKQYIHSQISRDR